jgi:hypothetical protein
MLVKLSYAFKGKGIAKVCAIWLQDGGEHTFILRNKGVLQLALQLNVELHKTPTTHYIYTLWVILDKLHKL